MIQNSEPLIYGALRKVHNWWRKGLLQLASPAWKVLVIPGPEILQISGYQIKNITTNPRLAQILLIGPHFPESLHQHAATIYAQMPRPRVIVSYTPNLPDILPAADVILDIDNQPDEGLEQARSILISYGFATKTKAYQQDFLEPKQQDHSHHHHGHEGHHHHEHHDMEQHMKDHDHNSSVVDHAEHMHHHKMNKDADHSQNEHHDMASHENEHQHHEMSHDDEQHSENGHDHHKHVHQQHRHKDSDQSNQEHDMEDMDMNHGNGGGGMMMSMEMMTKDLPKAADGLAMERNNLRLGPFFPGLPSGLMLKIELDGDTITQSGFEQQMSPNPLPEDFHKNNIHAADLPAIFYQHFPHLPHTYQLLAYRALKHLCTTTNGELSPGQEVYYLEKERVSHHLLHLQQLGRLAGNRTMSDHSHRFFTQIISQGADVHIYEKIKEWRSQISSQYFLKTRLRTSGILSDDKPGSLTGPIARASSQPSDYRTNLSEYQELEFKMSSSNENNAWGRLLVRMDEIIESVRLLNELSDIEKNQRLILPELDIQDGESTAKLETPNGLVTLTLQVKESKIHHWQLSCPGSQLAPLIPHVSEGQEYGDGLLGIQSLSVSPWEFYPPLKKNT